MTNRIATLDEGLLLRLYAKERPHDLEAELVRRFMPLARSLAMRYRGSAAETEDLLQVASMALVKALRRYDPVRGRFPAFAAPTILGELRRHFRDHAWRLHVPRSLQERCLEIDRTSALLAEELGVTPSVAQIAKYLECGEESVLDALQAQDSQRSHSLDAQVHYLNGDVTSLIETIGCEADGFDGVEAQMAVERCADLTAQEHAVIKLMFVDDLNQYVIGERLGISQMQVSRLIRRGLAKLLEAVQGDENPSGRRALEETRPDARFPNGRRRARVRSAATRVGRVA